MSSSLRRSSSNETLNKDFILSKPLASGYRKDILISCNVDAYAEPRFLSTEKVPILTPGYELTKSDASENDLYFLRWVFNGMFEQLTNHLNEKYPGYQLLRPEIEPGISWDDFRSNRRGLLLWLTRSYSYENPVEYLVDYLKKLSLDSSSLNPLDPLNESLGGDDSLGGESLGGGSLGGESENSMSVKPSSTGAKTASAKPVETSASAPAKEWVRYGVFVGAMARQVQAMDNQLTAFEQEIKATRKGFSDMWKIMVNSYPGVAHGSDHDLASEKSPRSHHGLDPSTQEGEGWSVVEDDDDEVDADLDAEEHGLTSASLSGYDDYDESDLN